MTKKSGREFDAPNATRPALTTKRAAATQNAVISTFGLERRAGWNVSKRAMRPINLERRARFARIETA